ncbi:MAG: tRNA (5-methylaminomethyl-2-thiouridine)(34)-methyltransferase MnmD [Bacteroidales bacterium]|nr:tRNA (5-methylaminomethyl-2-thiouridine)(34)-methyltransferase MnmD [Bacteroidales bacterium]
MDPEIRVTADGSHTLYVPSLDEHYHSHFGAVTESKHIFISAGLASIESDDISILEVGFGTGLNALLTALYADERQTKVSYVTLEKFPLSTVIIKELNYRSLAGTAGERLFDSIHAAPWETAVKVTPWFTLHKREFDLTTMAPEGLYDIIYFDAFGPDKQPEMWTIEVMRKIAAVTHPGSVLVTYSAKGKLKRMLRELGFEVKLLPGPPGKRVITRAVKQ